MAHVFEGLEAAFASFGGVPTELLFDQMKAVITRDERDAGGRVTENAEFLRFAYHWDFRVRACRPYRAKTKGKVERPVSYVRSSFFYGRTFTSDSDLNAQAQHWLDTVANVRIHSTLKERPIDRLERELGELKRSPCVRIAPMCCRRRRGSSSGRRQSCPTSMSSAGRSNATPNSRVASDDGRCGGVPLTS